MPVPQRVNFFVRFSSTGKMPVPQRINFIVGWGGLLARPSDLTFALQTQQDKLSFLRFIKIVIADQN